MRIGSCGISFDIDALTGSSGTLLLVPVFLLLFLVVRGVPTLISHRNDFVIRDRIAAGMLSVLSFPATAFAIRRRAG